MSWLLPNNPGYTPAVVGPIGPVLSVPPPHDYERARFVRQFVSDNYETFGGTIDDLIKDAKTIYDQSIKKD